MIIERIHVGAHGKKILYVVSADAMETGDVPHRILRFDDVRTAAVVMKYLRGDALGTEDESLAKEALSNYDR